MGGGGIWIICIRFIPYILPFFLPLALSWVFGFGEGFACGVRVGSGLGRRRGHSRRKGAIVGSDTFGVLFLHIALHMVGIIRSLGSLCCVLVKIVDAYWGVEVNMLQSGSRW